MDSEIYSTFLCINNSSSSKDEIHVKQNLSNWLPRRQFEQGPLHFQHIIPRILTRRPSQLGDILPDTIRIFPATKEKSCIDWRFMVHCRIQTMMEIKGYTAEVEFDDSIDRLYGRVISCGFYPIATFEATDFNGIRRESHCSIKECLKSHSLCTMLDWLTLN